MKVFHMLIRIPHLGSLCFQNVYKLNVSEFKQVKTIKKTVALQLLGITSLDVVLPRNQSHADVLSSNVGHVAMKPL